MLKKLPKLDKIDKKISSKATKVIILHLLYILATLLTSSFIHIFLWRLRSDLSYIAYFDLTFVAATLLGYFLSSYLLTYFRSDKILRVSFLVLAFAYVQVLYFQESIINYLFLLGFFNGLGNGLYWGAYNILKIRETTNENREHFFGIIHGVFTILATVFPALAGFIIVFLPQLVGLEFAGYYFLYALSIGLLFIMSGYVEVLPKFKTKSFKLEGVLDLVNSKTFRDISFYELLAGFYETGTKMVLIVFSFIILKNEFNLGLFSSFFGLITGLYVYFVGRKIDIKKRSEIVLIGALLIFVGRIIFINYLSVEALVVDRLLESLGGPLFGLPVAAVILSTIETRSHFKLEKEQEYLTASEIPLNFGRFFGSLFFIILLTIFGTQNISMIKIWFFVVSATTIAQWCFIKRLNQS